MTKPGVYNTSRHHLIYAPFTIKISTLKKKMSQFTLRTKGALMVLQKGRGYDLEPFAV